MPTRPTTKQLSYLKSLANRAGQTFTYPRTTAQASREIMRLKSAEPSSPAERYTERKAIADQIATGAVHDSARVREDEISGRGSSTTWAHNRDQEPAIKAERPLARRMTPAVGPRTELARYTVAEGERIIYGQRVDGVVRVTDRPAGSGGRSYLIERDLDRNEELQALVGDYLAQAAKLDMPPVAASLLIDVLDAVA